MLWQRWFLKKLLKVDPPQVIQERCISYKMRLMDCDKCSRKCPQNAIKVRKGKVLLSPEDCSGCGICAGACPTHAIKPENLNYHTKFKEIVQKEQPVLGCDMESDNVDVSFPCLFSLDGEFLQSLVLKLGEQGGQQLSFYFGNCFECENFDMYPQFMKSLKKASTLINSLGLNFNFNSITSKENLKPNTYYYSRREILRVFREDTFKAVQDVTEDIIPRDRTGLPESRRLLVAQLKKYQESDLPAKNTLTLGGLKVVSQCTACGLCVKSCMNQALSLQTGEYETELFHKPWRCFNCGICRNICPPKVLKRTAVGGKIKNILNSKKLFTMQRKIM
ncbi:4Fe-4S dicluster domain-containing protein [Natranaerobius thermophilus]|uniref:4Fe-4S ferredoxin iron-sulfur binding domain protein n=2 Tax=Natranaerobius TaxID=375928 RepID=B2A8G3_NATTJ|nr:4Fe-4S ferredoxin iron-sulfur binding domain protein [Natranaerobius thermophilus JW/NM-WN-LF]